MKAWQAQALREAEQKLKRLEKMGYIIKQHTEWHWLVTRDDSDVAVDVWPSSMKFMQKGAHSSGDYENIIVMLNDLFDYKSLDKEEIKRRLDAKTQAMELRNDPMAFIKKFIPAK